MWRERLARVKMTHERAPPKERSDRSGSFPWAPCHTVATRSYIRGKSRIAAVEEGSEALDGVPATARKPPPQAGVHRRVGSVPALNGLPTVRTLPESGRKLPNPVKMILERTACRAFPSAPRPASGQRATAARTPPATAIPSPNAAGAGCRTLPRSKTPPASIPPASPATFAAAARTPSSRTGSLPSRCRTSCPDQLSTAPPAFAALRER